MRVHETDPTIAAKSREQGAKAQLFGGMIFAVGMVLMVLAGPSIWPLPLAGLVIGCLSRMVVDSNRVGR